jgi:flavin prenyltransferase
VVPAMPGFYRLPETIADLVDFVAGRVLAAAGLDAALVKPWGSR